jgi:hypothetical protein
MCASIRTFSLLIGSAVQEPERLVRPLGMLRTVRGVESGEHGGIAQQAAESQGMGGA